MRALSLAQASRCETAKTPHCRCRCHGVLHGAARLINPTAERDRQFYEILPPDDPHHVRSKEEVRQRKRMQRAEKKHPGQGRLFGSD